MNNNRNANLYGEISSDAIFYTPPDFSCPDEDNTPIRELVVWYGLSQEEANKLIGDTEEQTEENVKKYKESHSPVLVFEGTLDKNKYKYNIHYGYYTENGVLRKDEHEQRVIKIILDMRSVGMSYRAICNALNKYEIKPKRGKQWYISVIKKILQREGNNR